MEAYTTFLYSLPLWIYLYYWIYSIVGLEKHYSPKLWSFVLCPHHSTLKFALIYLQWGSSLLHMFQNDFRQCCRTHWGLLKTWSNWSKLLPQENEKNQNMVGHPGLCVLDNSHGSVSTENISQGGRRSFGVFLNQTNGFPLHDHQTFFW